MRADDTYGKDWPRCPHGKQLTTDGCPQCLRDARKLAATAAG